MVLTLARFLSALIEWAIGFGKIVTTFFIYA